MKKNRYLIANRQTGKQEAVFNSTLRDAINKKNVELFQSWMLERQQEQEMDKAFEFIVHELMMETWNTMLCDDAYWNGYPLDRMEEFSIIYLKKVEDSL